MIERPTSRTRWGASIIDDVKQAARAVAACLLLTATAPLALAQDYPTKPVRLVVPFPAGSGLDVVGRLMGRRLNEMWARPVVIDNRAGAAGTIGADIVAKAPRDGYTLLIAGLASLGTAKGLYSKLPYDPVKDFAPIMLIARAPSVLLVNASLPVKSVKDLIAHVKANPGKLYYTSGGNGSVAHLSTEMFKHMAGLDIVHVPHKGPPQALTAVASGEAQIGMQSQLSAGPLVQSGRIRIIGVTSAKRLANLPDVPTIAEGGVPGYEFYVWYGVAAPAGTPPRIVSLLNRDFAKVARLPDVTDMFLNQGSEMVVSTPREFGEFIEREVGTWTRVIKAVGARID